MSRTKHDGYRIGRSETRGFPCRQEKYQGHEAQLNGKYDEDDDEQTQMVQLYVGVREGVAEGGVDDHEQNDAAHRPERRLSAVQKLPQEPPAHLSNYEWDDYRHEQLRENGGERDRRRGAQKHQQQKRSEHNPL